MLLKYFKRNNFGFIFQLQLWLKIDTMIKFKQPITCTSPLARIKRIKIAKYVRLQICHSNRDLLGEPTVRLNPLKQGKTFRLTGAPLGTKIEGSNLLTLMSPINNRRCEIELSSKIERSPWNGCRSEFEKLFRVGISL